MPEFIEATLAQTPVLKIVPMLGGLGCPWTCSLCIDSTVPYQPLGFDQMRSDLRQGRPELSALVEVPESKLVHLLAQQDGLQPVPGPHLRSMGSQVRPDATGRAPTPPSAPVPVP